MGEAELAGKNSGLETLSQKFGVLAFCVGFWFVDGGIDHLDFQ